MKLERIEGKERYNMATGGGECRFCQFAQLRKANSAFDSKSSGKA